jgi:hypothetical protein
MMATIYTHATIKELLEAASSVQSMPRLYNEDQKQLGVRRPPACEVMSPKKEERPLLEDVTKQSSKVRD